MKMKSLNIGSVRSTEAFIENDPPEAEELNQLNQNAAEALEKALADYEGYKPYKLIGIGGTATTVSTIKQKLKIYDSEQVHQSIVTKAELETIIQNLSSKTIDERRQIVGLEAKRADIIIAGTSILDNILTVTGKDSFVVCDYNNLEGAAYSRFFANEK